MAALHLRKPRQLTSIGPCMVTGSVCCCCLAATACISDYRHDSPLNTFEGVIKSQRTTIGQQERSC